MPSNAVALIDEGYLQFHSRTSMTSENRSLSGLINLSRQRNQTLIFVSQEARQLDVNVVSQADVLTFKEHTEISREFERPQLRKINDKARAAIQTIRGSRRPWTWFHSESTDFEGLLKNDKPTFWTLSLSRAFAQAPKRDGESPSRRGRKLSRNEQKDEVRKLRQSGFSYERAAEMMGVSKATAWRLDNEE